MQLNVIQRSEQQRAVVFPQGSAELLCTRASAFNYVNVPCPTVFCEALAPVHAFEHSLKKMVN